MRQHLGVERDVGAERHFDDVLDALGRQPPSRFALAATKHHDVLCARASRDGNVIRVADDAYDLRVGRGRETDGAQAHGANRALYDHPAAGDWPCHEHRTVRGDAGNAETGGVLEGHAVWQWERLRAEAPHALPDACGSDPFADLMRARPSRIKPCRWAILKPTRSSVSPR